ncbi:MAG TPA: prepilin-type N-terminal cleavage/methylation domain-containing protein [Candidatus Acidoferrales bacterium]
MKTQRRKNAGFSLIELLISMAVVLILVGGIAVAGARSLAAGRETSAVQSAQSFVTHATVYQKNWGGYPALAANLGGAGLAAPAACTNDNDITTAQAASYDAGTAVNSGYTLSYKGLGPFTGTSACGVVTTFDFTANPVDAKTKSFCSDENGTYYLPAGTAMANTGAGCLIDNAAALPVGQ